MKKIFPVCLLLDASTAEGPGGSDVAAILIVVAVVGYFVWKRTKKKKAGNALPVAGSKIRTVESKDGSTALYAKVSKEEGKGVSTADVQKLRDDFLYIVTTNDKQQETNAAAKMMLAGAYDATIEAYTILNKKYPAETAKWQNQIGAAYYFKGDYDKAIEHYATALSDAGNAAMADDNIWEAVEEKFKKTGVKADLETYGQYCPQGRHISEMEKLLSGPVTGQKGASSTATLSFEEDYGLGKNFEQFIAFVFNDAISSRHGHGGPVVPTAITVEDEEDGPQLQRYFLDDYGESIASAEEHLKEGSFVYAAVNAEVSLSWSDGKTYDAVWVRVYNADYPEGWVFVQPFVQEDETGDIELVGKCTLIEMVPTVL